jgi:predicted small lipoprotein YifL
MLTVTSRSEALAGKAPRGACANIRAVEPRLPSLTVRPILPLLIVLLLAACGYKGPLYLPKPKPESPPAAAKPAPEPKKEDSETAR